jgi:hypothetical protein
VYQKYAGIGFFVALCAEKILFLSGIYIFDIIKKLRLFLVAKKGTRTLPVLRKILAA